jgi:hypothetical protein
VTPTPTSRRSTAITASSRVEAEAALRTAGNGTTDFALQIPPSPTPFEIGSVVSG